MQTKKKIIAKLENIHSAKYIYRTLKAIKRNQESNWPIIDPDIMKEFFV